MRTAASDSVNGGVAFDRIPGAPAPSQTPVEVDRPATFVLDPLSCEETPSPPPRPTTHASTIWLEDGDPPPNVFPWPDSPRGAPPAPSPAAQR